LINIVLLQKAGVQAKRNMASDRVDKLTGMKHSGPFVSSDTRYQYIGYAIGLRLIQMGIDPHCKLGKVEVAMGIKQHVSARG
jgi:hypothetical protein